MMLMFFAMVTVLAFNSKAESAERIVVLAPAAGEILQKCGAGEKIVGVTKNIDIFEEATKVGTHIRPNMELIRSLKPDLIVYSSNRFFPEDAAEKLGAESISFDPSTLVEIAEQTKSLCEKAGFGQNGDGVVKDFLTDVSSLEKPNCIPKVVYEVTAEPYTVAGQGNIVSDIISKAGGLNVVRGAGKNIRFSTEIINVLKPDYYIFQTGPMNKEPGTPWKRNYLKNSNALFINVNQLEWTRAGVTSFKKMLELNSLFVEFCNTGGHR